MNRGFPERLFGSQEPTVGLSPERRHRGPVSEGQQRGPIGDIRKQEGANRPDVR